ncbi:MAG: DUF2805 domain-containing protein [Flavobacteriales bacterium]|nr:DUF2805 domain-containing protein [Flavobacteriales bacterium]
MALEDRTPFDAIFITFGLKENAARGLMRKELSAHPLSVDASELKTGRPNTLLSVGGNQRGASKAPTNVNVHKPLAVSWLHESHCIPIGWLRPSSFRGLLVATRACFKRKAQRFRKSI